MQFTPDLLPADITGTDVLNEVDTAACVRRELSFMPGPIFKNLVLADEINRTPPKTQAALLAGDAGAARDGRRRRRTLCRNPFQVFATRNPIEQEGTYPLPEAQLDRFLLEVHVEYPSESEEREIARRTTSGLHPEIEPVRRRSTRSAQLGALVPRIPVTDEAVELAVRLARASRPAERRCAGRRSNITCASARARAAARRWCCAAKARAALRGEAAADVEDVAALALPALRHRLVLSYRAEADGVRDADVVRAIATETAGICRLRAPPRRGIGA